MKFALFVGLFTTLWIAAPFAAAVPTVVNEPDRLGVIVNEAAVVQDCSAMTHCERYGYVFVSGGVIVDPSWNANDTSRGSVGLDMGAGALDTTLVDMRPLYVVVGPGPEPPPGCGFACPSTLVQWVLDQLP